MLLLLSDSVAMRLRESGVGGAYTVKVNATDAALFSYGKQERLPLPVLTAGEIAERAAELLRELNPPYPLRGLGVTVSDFAAGERSARAPGPRARPFGSVRSARWTRCAKNTATDRSAARRI